MFQMKSVLLLVLLILPLFFSVQAKSFLLSAEGEGEDLAMAKASAITALSESVLSSVKSTFSSDVKVRNDDVDRDMRSTKKIESSQIFKGVIYFNESPTAEGIRISAGLDQSGVNDTIAYLKSLLDLDYSILSIDEKREALVVADKLSAFISVFDKSVLSKHQGIKRWIKNKRVELLKHLNLGRITFVLEKVKDYQVEINGKPVVNGDFLEEGAYEFSASADKFRSIRGEFYISAGENNKIKLPFIRMVKNKILSLQLPADFLFLKNNIEDVLSDLGIKIKPVAKNNLIVKIKESSASVDGYRSHKVKVRIEAYRNDARVKKVSLKKTIVVEQGEEGKLEAAINNLVIKGVVALMSRIDLNDYFTQ